MALVTKEQIEEDARKADALLDDLSKPVIEPTGVPTSAPIAPTLDTPTPNVDEVTKLNNEISELKKQMEDKNSSTWESRYLSLQGINKVMAKDMQEMKEQIKTIQEKPPTTQEPLTSNSTSDALDKLKQDYGDGIINDFKGMIASAITDALGTTLKDHDNRVAKVEETQGKTIEQTFFSTLASAVPDWKQINGWEEDNISIDPKWDKFLQQQVPGTMTTYNKVLHAGYNSYNAEAVIRVFNLYKEAIKSEVPPTLAPVAPTASVVPSIDTLVDPGSSGGGAAPINNNQKEIYTKKQVDDFYGQVTKKTFRGTKAEQEALGDKYQLAIIEGRVI